MLKLHAPDDMFIPIAPYAQALEATEAKRFLFISGTMGLEPDGQLADGFENQCDRAWKNIGATLKSADMDFSNLAKITIWLARSDDWKKAVEIRKRHLGDHKVAATIVQVGFIHPAWLLEIEAIAVA